MLASAYLFLQIKLVVRFVVLEMQLVAYFFERSSREWKENTKIAEKAFRSHEPLLRLLTVRPEYGRVIQRWRIIYALSIPSALQLDKIVSIGP